MSIIYILKKLKSKVALDKEDIAFLLSEFEHKNPSRNEIKNLTVYWNKKGITSSELYELANLINQRQKQITKFKESIDICGTGGDKANTFNISTLSAIVASSCGAKVIKHSGKSTTSITGSVDILKNCGVKIDYSQKSKETCFKKIGLMFVSSKLLRNLFSEVKTVCKELKTPGFVNLLGPLTNPYLTKYQILGVSSFKWGELLANTIKIQNSKAKTKKEVIIVCCKINKNQFLDEFSFCGTNYIWRIQGISIKRETLKLDKIQEKRTKLNELMIKNVNDGQVIFKELLKGKTKIKSKINVVALNSGYLLLLAKKVKSLEEGVSISLQHIKSGKAWEHFQNFVNSIKRR